MLKMYLTPPLAPSSEVDRSDYFTGDGVRKVFALLNKRGIRVGSTIQVDAGYLLRELGDFVVSGDSIIFATAPAYGSTIIVPGINGLLLRAYDQNVVPGDSSPRIKAVSFYVGDIENIDVFKHSAPPGYGGIRLSLTDHNLSFGAPTSWYRLAQAIGSGGPSGYAAPGAYIEIPGFGAVDTVQVNISAFGTSVTVLNGAQFNVGDTLVVDFGMVTENQVVIESIAGNVLTTTSFDDAHLAGATVYQCARKCWLEQTIPLNAASNTPINFYDNSIDVAAVSESRY